MSLSSQCGFAIAALAVTALATIGCDADFSRPDAREEVGMQQLPQPVRQTIETQFPGASPAKVEARVEKRRRSGRELYLAFGTGKNHGERMLLDGRGKVVGMLHGEDGAAANANALGPRSGEERLARRDAACPARLE